MSVTQSVPSSNLKIPSELSPPASEAAFKFLAGAFSDSEPGNHPDLSAESSSRRWKSSFKAFGGALVLVSITISLIFVVSFTTFSSSIDHSVEEILRVVDENQLVNTTLARYLSVAEVASLGGPDTASGARALAKYPAAKRDFFYMVDLIVNEVDGARDEFESVAREALDELEALNDNVVELAMNGTAAALAEANAIIHSERYGSRVELFLVGYGVVSDQVDVFSQSVSNRLASQETLMIVMLVVGAILMVGALLVIGRRVWAMLNVQFQVMADVLAARQHMGERINVEKSRMRALMTDVFPEHCVKHLENGRRPPLDQFDSVTVVFADLIGFTDLSARSTPSEIVGMLNKLYSQYDEIAQRHGLFKVEMVGDEYMALAGMPTVLAEMDGDQREKAGQHWRAALEYAIEVQHAVESFVTHAGSKVGVRIGIATGPVVAALIGDSRSRYQVFGDTVNLASRMESTAPGHGIQVAESTYQFLQRTPGRFEFEERSVDVKGKGTISTYVLKSVNATQTGITLPGTIE